MRDKRGIHAQFEIMLDFMEQNGDISKPPPGSQGRLDNLQKWLELAELLNKSRGQSRPLEKWRKTWSDLKNNTKRKAKRHKEGEGAELTELEKRLMKLLRDQNGVKIGCESDDDNNEITFKEEIEPDPIQRTLSPAPQYFCAVNGTTSHRRKSTASSYASDSSSSRTSSKRKKHLNDEIKDVTDRYFEFEREREKMAHEREMARIKQNDQLINIFGRMVNVLETLTPSIQRYLNRNDNEGG
ncbi:uncharacterized protein LOC142977061 [Anticarsia gemmatalis]|uniref:uncharacterized protein LOC142977061 n=1 Tax=Anticarsia gemmatalis TaxID=129554 RepID=UPI003F75B87E